MKNFRSAFWPRPCPLSSQPVPQPRLSHHEIRVGASPTPHAEILKVANDVLKPQGYELQIIEYSDYVQPNMALEARSWMPTSSSTSPILTISTRKRAPSWSPSVPCTTNLRHLRRQDEVPWRLKDGAMVAVPNDTTNEARACRSSSPTAHQAEGRRRPHRHPPRHRGKPQEAQDRRNRSGSARPRPA